MVSLNQIRTSVMALIILSIFGYVYMYIDNEVYTMKNDAAFNVNVTDVTANNGNIAKLVFVLGALGVAIAMVFSFMKK